MGDISQELQTKLLRVLQEREFERVGGLKSIWVDIRIIAATSRNLEDSVKDGHFREDLYHRLNVVPINIPSLRDRQEDIPPLSQHFLRRFSLETRKQFSEITKEAQEKLLDYEWPGNVRELANVMERAIVLGREQNITVKDLPSRIAAARCRRKSNGLSYHEAMESARREVIEKALTEARGNRAAAAKSLGLHEKYVLRLIKTLQID